MRSTESATERMSLAEARKHWSALVTTVSREKKQIVLEQDGVSVAALISVRDLERLRRYDAAREADFAVLDRIGAAFADVPSDELEREVTKALAEVRAEMRAERAQAERGA